MSVWYNALSMLTGELAKRDPLELSERKKQGQQDQRLTSRILFWLMEKEGASFEKKKNAITGFAALFGFLNSRHSKNEEDLQ